MSTLLGQACFSSSAIGFSSSAIGFTTGVSCFQPCDFGLILRCTFLRFGSRTTLDFQTRVASACSLARSLRLQHRAA